MPTGQRSRAKRTSEQDLLYEEKAKEKLCDIPNSVSWSCRRCRTCATTPPPRKIYDAAVKECPGLSLGTVYRNLNSLVDAGRVRRVSIPGKADRFDHTLPWHSHLYCTVCGSVTDAEVDEKQVMKLVKNQKGYVQDCAVVLIGVCEVCCEKQAQENAH